jgi:hypothetical protein
MHYAHAVAMLSKDSLPTNAAPKIKNSHHLQKPPICNHFEEYPATYRSVTALSVRFPD